MSPKSLFVAAAFFLFRGLVEAEVPKTLERLDLPAADFPDALETFVASPDSESLTFQDAFFLLGACEMIWVPENRDDPLVAIEKGKKLKALMAPLRILAWRKAEAAGAERVLAYAQEQRRLAPKLPFNPPEQKDPVLTSADNTKLLPAFAGSEAFECGSLLAFEATAAKVKAKRPKVKWPAPRPLPDDLARSVPQSLARPLAVFLSVVSSYLSALPAKDGKEPADNVHDQSTIATLELLLSKGLKEAVEEAQRQINRRSSLSPVWPWHTLPSLGNVPALTRLLEEERWEEAAGYALFLFPSSNSPQGRDRANQTTCDVLATLLPDWDEAVLGKHILEEIFSVRGAENYLPGDSYWEFISSPEVAGAALHYFRWAKLKSGEASIDPWLALLDVRVSFEGEARKLSFRNRPLPDDVRDELVAKYATRWTKIKDFFKDMRTEIDVFALVNVPESHRRLREYLDHPSAALANRAAAALRGFGEDVKDRPADEPLIARFFLNQQPITARRVWCQPWHLVEGKLTSGWSSGYLKTDHRGDLRVPADFFVERNLHYGTARYVSFVVDAPPGKRSYSDPGLSLLFATPYPENFERPLQFAAQTVEPRVVLDTAPGVILPAGEKARLWMSRAPVEGIGNDVLGAMPTQLVALGATTLRPIQAGKWRLRITAPGVADWSDVVDFTADAPPVVATLQHGTSITITLPDEIYAPLFPRIGLKLEQEGKPWETQWVSIRTGFSGSNRAQSGSLPAGKYKVKMLSSAEWHNALGPAEPKWHGPHFQAQEKEFTVSKDTASQLDLGSFDLKPVK